MKKLLLTSGMGPLPGMGGRGGHHHRCISSWRIWRQNNVSSFNSSWVYHQNRSAACACTQICVRTRTYAYWFDWLSRGLSNTKLITRVGGKIQTLNFRKATRSFQQNWFGLHISWRRKALDDNGQHWKYILLKCLWWKPLGLFVFDENPLEYQHVVFVNWKKNVYGILLVQQKRTIL